MKYQKANIKIKIFLAAVLVFLSTMLAYYVYNIISVNNEYVKEESQTSTNCLSTYFDIIKAENINESLVLTIQNKRLSDYDIIKINLDLGDSIISKDIEIFPSETEKVSFNNLTDFHNLKVFPNNCDKFSKSISVI